MIPRYRPTPNFLHDLCEGHFTWSPGHLTAWPPAVIFGGPPAFTICSRDLRRATWPPAGSFGGPPAFTICSRDPRRLPVLRALRMADLAPSGITDPRYKLPPLEWYRRASGAARTFQQQMLPYAFTQSCPTFNQPNHGSDSL
jgi:hypothetical protein